MPISNNLILDLVKNTKKKETNNKKETFVQGTIVRNENGEVCVKIYGTEIATPVSITNNVDTTKPVTVMLKNHTATVIGNVSAESVETNNNILNSTQESISYIDPSVITKLWADYEKNK